MGDREKRTSVVSRHGRYPFQTGMVTASLLRRGLRMDDAVRLARSVRESFAGRDEVTTDEIAARIDELVVEALGPDAPGRPSIAAPPRALPMVTAADGTFPFSRGVLVRHLDTAGVGLEASSQLLDGLERWIRRRPTSLLRDTELYERVAHMLAASQGHEYARRFRFATWVRRSETPIIILIGGATGTGKSTLAMELAYRLGVHWVTSTDMVRETMRAVVPPALVPGLHDHSFRGMLMGGQVLSNPRERVIAGYRQQAEQVAIGVKAVIQRAIQENAHVIIEGIHLAPPFEQYLPPDTDALVAGFVLAVPDEKAHMGRFRERSTTQPERPAVTYLDAFQSVRWIQSDLLRMAEDAEAVVLSNVDRRSTLTGAVDILSRGLPVEELDNRSSAQRQDPSRGPGIPTLILILDGLGDEPNPVLGNKTPLAAADKPTLRKLAALGGQGRVRTGDDGPDVPSTDEGLMAVLAGPNTERRLARGLFEAVGQGIPLPVDSVLLRGNLATVEADGAIVDRRAGRIRGGVEDLLADLRSVTLTGGITARIYPGHEHRLLVMLLGPGLSPAVADTDPGSDAEVQQVIEPHSLDGTPEAGRTAEALHELMAIARERLQGHPVNQERLARGLPVANAIITRGAAAAPRKRQSRQWVGTMVARCNTALGVARYLGLRTATSQRMTGNLDTDLDAKFETAGTALAATDSVVIHVKGTDVAAHDRRPVEKRDFITAIDAALGRFLANNPQLSGKLRVVVCADHGTSSLTGDHIADPVPLLLATWNADATEEAEFSEETAVNGALGDLGPGDLVELLGLTANPKQAHPLDLKSA